IYHPAARDTSIAAGILEQLHVDPAKLVPVPLGMARDRRNDQETYAAAAERIAEDLDRAQWVAWIAEGDSLVYGTFCHVYDELRKRRPAADCEIVPGVSSVHAATAALGVAAANLDERIAIIPAAYGLDELPDLVRRFDSVFLLKVHSS